MGFFTVRLLYLCDQRFIYHLRIYPSRHGEQKMLILADISKTRKCDFHERDLERRLRNSICQTLFKQAWKSYEIAHSTFVGNSME